MRAPSGVKLDIGYEVSAGVVKAVRGDSAQACTARSGRLFGQSCCPSSPRSVRLRLKHCLDERGHAAHHFVPALSSDDLQAGLHSRLLDGNG